MARPCTVCSHPERQAVDAAILRGDKNRRVAAQYNLVESSIRRHLPHLARAVQAAQAAQATMVRQQRTLDSVVEACEADLEAVLAAHRPTVADRDSGELVIKAVAQRAKLAALQFGTKRTTTVIEATGPAGSPSERLDTLRSLRAEADAEIEKLERGDLQ